VTVRRNPIQWVKSWI